MRRLLPRLGLSVALVTAFSACTGVLNDDGSTRGIGPSAGSANGSGSPALPGSAGTTMTSGAGGSAGGAVAAADVDNRVMRRLNHADYNNTVRDLLGTSLRPADKLPDDETAENFDTIGEVLSLSPSHFETFEQAASQLIDELYALPQADARRGAVLVCQPQAGAEATCARQILSGLARRAYRRPVSDAEVSSLLQLVDKVRAAGESYEGALKAALTATHYMYTNMKFPRPLVGPGGGPHGIRLFVSIMKAFGIPDKTFGDGSAQGPLEELLV